MRIAYRGIVLTARASLKLLMLEALRRVMHREYIMNGVWVRDDSTFRVLRNSILKGYRMWMEGDRYYVRTHWGIVSASQASLLGSAINADFDVMYGGDYSGAVVVDIGGYIGETALYFLSKGAKFVHVYEPVFWREAEFNLRGKPAKVYPFGVWWDKRKVRVSVEESSTGLHIGCTEIETVPLSEVLETHDPDVVKLNCEGCEYSLLLLDCESIRKRRWIVEVHGPEPVLAERFRECGLKPCVIVRKELTSVIEASPERE